MSNGRTQQFRPQRLLSTNSVGLEQSCISEGTYPNFNYKTSFGNSRHWTNIPGFILKVWVFRLLNSSVSGRNFGDIFEIVKYCDQRRDPKVTRLSIELEKIRDFNWYDKLIPLADVIFMSKDFARHLGYRSMEETIDNIHNRYNLTGTTVIVPWGEQVRKSCTISTANLGGCRQGIKEFASNLPKSIPTASSC